MAFSTAAGQIKVKIKFLQKFDDSFCSHAIYFRYLLDYNKEKRIEIRTVYIFQWKQNAFYVVDTTGSFRTLNLSVELSHLFISDSNLRVNILWI